MESGGRGAEGARWRVEGEEPRVQDGGWAITTYLHGGTSLDSSLEIVEHSFLLCLCQRRLGVLVGVRTRMEARVGMGVSVMRVKVLVRVIAS